MRVEDWTSFAFSYALDLRSVVPHILAIEQHKAAAQSPVLPPRWLEPSDALVAEALREATDRYDESSLAIAAAPSPDSSVAQPAPQDQAAAKPQPIHDTSMAEAWLRRRFMPGSAPLALSDILSIHWMVAEQGGANGKGAGVLRTFGVEVGRPEVGGIHHGAPAQQLPLLMARYVEFVNGATLPSLPAVIHALLAHFFLDTIHPFLDGNGRTSRLVAAAILSQRGYNLHGSYGLVRHFYRHQMRYHIILHKAWQRCPFDVTPFVAFGMEGFVLELKSVETFIKMKRNRIADRDVSMPAFAGRIGAHRRGLDRPNRIG